MEKLKTIIQAFRDGGGEGKPVHLKVDVSWAMTKDEAQDLAYAHWRFNALGSTTNAELRQPEEFDAATRHLCPEDMHEHVLISECLEEHVLFLREREALGIASIDVHQVGTNQKAFLEAYGRDVLPAVRANVGQPTSLR